MRSAAACGCGARDGGWRGARRAARGTRAVAAALPWRRGGAAAAVVADFGGEKDGEREEVAVVLTEGSFWAGKCRRWELNEEGEARVNCNGGRGDLRLDSSE